jgi:hypothetical protein
MASDVWYWFGENCIYKFILLIPFSTEVYGFFYIESKDSLHYYYHDNIFTNNCLNCGYGSNEILSSAAAVAAPKRSYLVRKLLTIFFY